MSRIENMIWAIELSPGVAKSLYQHLEQFHDVLLIVRFQRRAGDRAEVVPRPSRRPCISSSAGPQLHHSPTQQYAGLTHARSFRAACVCVRF